MIKDRPIMDDKVITAYKPRDKNDLLAAPPAPADENRWRRQIKLVLLSNVRRSILLFNRMLKSKELSRERGFTYSSIIKMMSSSHRASKEETIEWLERLVLVGLLTKRTALRHSAVSLTSSRSYYMLAPSAYPTSPTFTCMLSAPLSSTPLSYNAPSSNPEAHLESLLWFNSADK